MPNSIETLLQQNAEMIALLQGLGLHKEKNPAKKSRVMGKGEYKEYFKKKQLKKRLKNQ